jgi:membrane-bound ClpP family serine protease
MARKLHTETAPAALPDEEVAANENASDKSRSTPKWFTAIQEKDNDKLREGVSEEIKKIIAAHHLSDYAVLFLLDEKDSISNYHADQIYAAASSLKTESKNILLIVNSPGGSIEPAYLISKALRRLAKARFVVAVPRRAKSAATLLSLGADEIHMGIMSELGPIDPQFGGLPALALGNALDVIADLTCRFPESSSMFGKYISEQVPIRTLGYYQRISASAVQYAERLLADKTNIDAHAVAEKLVKHYQDHSFVIDVNEAAELLGNEIVKVETPEYKLADEIYKFLYLVSIFLEAHSYYWLVGGPSDFRNTVRDTTK